MKATVDANLCTGCELCVSTCPEVFSMNSNGIADAKNPVAAGAEASCKEAAENCPVTAIILS